MQFVTQRFKSLWNFGQHYPKTGRIPVSKSIHDSLKQNSILGTPPQHFGATWTLKIASKFPLQSNTVFVGHYSAPRDGLFSAACLTAHPRNTNHIDQTKLAAPWLWLASQWKQRHVTFFFLFNWRNATQIRREIYWGCPKLRLDREVGEIGE